MVPASRECRIRGDTRPRRAAASARAEALVRTMSDVKSIDVGGALFVDKCVPRRPRTASACAIPGPRPLGRACDPRPPTPRSHRRPVPDSRPLALRTAGIVMSKSRACPRPSPPCRPARCVPDSETHPHLSSLLLPPSGRVRQLILTHPTSRHDTGVLVVFRPDAPDVRAPPRRARGGGRARAQVRGGDAVASLAC